MATEGHAEPTGGEETRAHFVRAIASHASLPPQLTAETAAEAVMCAVTDRLTRGGAYRLLQALPEPVRALFETCVAHRTGPPTTMHRPEVVDCVADHLGMAPVHAEAICRAVLSAVRDELAPDVDEHVAAQLPADLKALWYSPAPSGASRTSDPDELVLLRADVFAAIERNAGVLPPGVDASVAFSTVMAALSKRFSGGEARHVFLGLPSTLRSLVASAMLHRGERAEAFGEGELVQRLSTHLAVDTVTAERLLRAVIAAVKSCLPAKDVEDVASQLPSDIRALWLES